MGGGTTQSKAPKYVREEHQELLGQMGGMGGIQPWTGERTVGFGVDQTGGLDAARTAAQDPQAIDVSQAEYMKTLQGDYMNPANNPGMRARYELGMRHALPSVMTGANQSGRFGSFAHGASLNDAASLAANQAVAAAEQDWMGAKYKGGEMFRESLAPGQTLFDIGAQQQQQAQRELEGQITGFGEAEAAPWQDLSNRLNALSAFDTGGMNIAKPGGVMGVGK
jgi:hypothetical protein